MIVDRYHSLSFTVHDLFFILFVMLFSNVGISVYVALSNIFRFYFEKENHLQHILKLFFEGPMSVVFRSLFFFIKGVPDLPACQREVLPNFSLGPGSVAMLVSTGVEERPEEETAEAMSDFAIENVNDSHIWV